MPSSATTLIAEIDRLAAEGFGFEDIAVKLRLSKASVRPFVIGRGK